MAVYAARVSRRRSHFRRPTFCIVGSDRWATAVFAARITSNGEGGLVQELLGLVVELYLRAVVRMNTRAPWLANNVLTQSVVVPDEVEVWRGAPQNLPT